MTATATPPAGTPLSFEPLALADGVAVDETPRPEDGPGVAVVEARVEVDVVVSDVDVDVDVVVEDVAALSSSLDVLAEPCESSELL